MSCDHNNTTDRTTAYFDDLVARAVTAHAIPRTPIEGTMMVIGVLPMPYPSRRFIVSPALVFAVRAARSKHSCR
jgi:hypothetical protein